MALTFTEILSDLAPAVTLADQVQKLIAALPPAGTAKPSDYTNLAAAILTAVGPLADSVDAQIKS
jgi:hypothetical protein